MVVHLHRRKRGRLVILKLVLATLLSLALAAEAFAAAVMLEGDAVEAAHLRSAPRR